MSSSIDLFRRAFLFLLALAAIAVASFLFQPALFVGGGQSTAQAAAQMGAPRDIQAGPGGLTTPTATTTGRPMNTHTITSTPTETATPCPMSFSDVHSADYFYEAVRYLYCEGAVSGYEDGTFRPYDNTTRGQLCKIVVAAMHWDIYTPPTPTFTDVLPGSPFYPYIETAYSHNIISGYTDNTFRPDNNVTRGQLCKIVALARGWYTCLSCNIFFSDVLGDNPFFEQIRVLAGLGMISGYSDRTFRPWNLSTRGQISKVVYLTVLYP